MTLIKKNNVFSIKLFVTILFSLFIFSSLTKAQNRYFYQLGYGYVEGNSHSTFVSPAVGQFGGNIQGYRADFGLGLSSEINKIKVDYIISYSPDAFNNQIDTKNSCPNAIFECRVKIKDSLDVGAKFYLPLVYNDITPTVYFGVSNADIQKKVLYGNGATGNQTEHQRNWGAAAGLGLNYEVNKNTAISLDYSWTAYEKNIEIDFISDVTTERSSSRPEIHSTSLKIKKYF
jgi:opacity protein-like surface antigen